MTIDLSTPLEWKTATGEAAKMLDQLQPNILKAHARDHFSALFLRFSESASAKKFLAALVPLMKSAKTHLTEVERFKTEGAKGSPYVGTGLTAAGYRFLKIDVPQDDSFRLGMRSQDTRERLNDPPRSTFDSGYHEEIHAVVIIADAADAPMTLRRNEVLALIPSTISVVAEEIGLGRVNAHGEGIEHFGYVDGRSQPLFLVEDIRAEKSGTDGITTWDPSAPLDRVLVPDHAAPDPTVHFGSYLVFRKLEQNVRRFKQAEEGLADQLGLVGEDRERAGAMVVGRFEDGTPLTAQREDGVESPVPNNFDYESDVAGAKCPFQAHIRKTNPRGSGGAEPPPRERRHLMVRRGVPYGERADDPNADLPPSARPSGGVGLLFMAFNAELRDQFEFTQAIWANNPGFPVPPDGVKPPGLDPVIGQGPRPESAYTQEWAGTRTVTADPFPQAVTLKGGDYFFMPSLAFLRGLGGKG